MSRRKQSKPQHVEFPDNTSSLAVGDASGETVASVTTVEKPHSTSGGLTDGRRTASDEASDKTRDIAAKQDSETAIDNGKDLTAFENGDAETSTVTEESETLHMAVHRASVDVNNDFSPESLSPGHRQFVSSHRTLLYSRCRPFQLPNQRGWNGRHESLDNEANSPEVQDQDTMIRSQVDADGRKRPRQEAEPRGEMYTCDRCNTKFEILLDYIRHRDFQCSENSVQDETSPDDDNDENSNQSKGEEDGGYVISGNVIMASGEELISERRRAAVDEEEGELNIDENRCGDRESPRVPSIDGDIPERKERTGASNEAENVNYHDTRSVSPDSMAESDKNDSAATENRSESRGSSNGASPNGERGNGRSAMPDETENIKKDIMAAEAMANAIQNMSAFASQTGGGDRPDISAIKYQVRMIQQQQAYQVQLLNFLQWQLAIASTNPHAAANPHINNRNPMSAGMMQPPFMPGMPNQPGNPLMPQMMAAMAMNNMNNFQNNAESNQAAEYAKSSLMMSAQQPADKNHAMRAVFAQADDNRCSENRCSEQEQRYQLKVAPDEELAVKADDKKDNKDEGDALRNSDSGFGGEENYPKITAADDASSSHGSQEEGELRDSALKSTAEEHRHRCRFCHKIFGSDSALQIHIRSHTGERPFKCNVCGNRFTTKGNLKVHFTRHKSKYPNIQMNGQPVPEFLDHLVTSNGLPYGMSILPEKAALERPRLHGNPSIHLTPQQAAMLNHRESQKFPGMLPADMQSNGKGENDCVERSSGRHADDRAGAADVASAIHAQLLQRRRAELLEAQWSGDSKNADPANPRDPKSQMSLLQAAMLPFLPGLAARHQIENVPPHLRYLLPQQLGAFQSQMQPNVSSSGGFDMKLPTLSRSASPGGNIKREVHYGDYSRPQTSSSETSKLQRLVENIDRGRVLQKNECHICHRILSCQSALKLHYRTHTGERPYKCDLCSRAFTTRGNLRTHYSSVHRQQMRPLPASNARSVNPEAYKCSLCTARFRDGVEFQRHMQMHAMVQAQRQQPVLERRGDSRSVSPNESAEAAVKTEDSIEDDIERVDSASVKSEASLEPPLSESREDINGNYADKLAVSPGSDEEFEGMRTESAGEDAGPGESKMDADRDGVYSSARSPARPLDSLAALSNLSNGVDVAGHGGTMLDHQLAALNRARAGRLTVCEICEKPFSCQSALEIHLRTHTKERPFLCRICQRAFTTKGNLKQHLLTHNITDIPEQMLAPVSSPKDAASVSSTPSSSPTPSEPRVSTATKRPSDRMDASEPPSKLGGFPRHWCHICQKQFSSASSLQIHNRTHTGEKPFACNVCGRAFTTKGNLKVHMGTHVWGAGGSRRGRRISMDNPLISPWMKNMTRAQPTQPTLQLPGGGQVADPAALYQQYAALARGILSAKQDAASRFMMPAITGQGVNSASSPVSSNGSPLTATELGSPKGGLAGNTNPNVSAATEWFLKAYQRTQGQVN